MPEHAPCDDPTARLELERSPIADSRLRVIGTALCTYGAPISAATTPGGLWFSMVSRTLVKKHRHRISGKWLHSTVRK